MHFKCKKNKFKLAISNVILFQVVRIMDNITVSDCIFEYKIFCILSIVVLCLSHLKSCCSIDDLTMCLSRRRW